MWIKCPNHNPSTQAGQWHDLFRSQREPLALVASIISGRSCSLEGVLLKAQSKIHDTTVFDGFHYPFAVRAVVQAAIDAPEVDGVMDANEMFDDESGELAYFRERMEALPQQERSVFFLRDILEYSRRETSLMLKASDVHADELLMYARKRLLLAGPVSIEGVKNRYISVGCVRTRKEYTARTGAIFNMSREGKLKCVVGEVFPLSAAHRAHEET